MWFITLALKNVIRRPLRSLLTIAAVGVAICALVALVGIAASFERSFLELYEGVGTDLVVYRAGVDPATSSVPVTLGAKLASVPGVREVLPGLMDIVSFENKGIYGVLVEGWEPNSYLFEHLTVLEGRLLRKGDQNCVLLGRVIAMNLEKSVGDTVEIMPGEAFKVVGVFESHSVFENSALLVLLEDLQRLMDREGEVTGFSLVTEYRGDDDALQSLRRRIESLDSGIVAIPSQQHVKSLPQLRLIRAMAWLTSVIALIVGSFGMANTMVMSVYERTREIGLLKAVGWRASRIVRLILLESVLLSLSGGVLGIISAVVLTKTLTKMPAVAGIISGHVEQSVVLLGFLIATAVGVIGGLLAAVRSMRLEVTDALRHE